MKNAKTNTNFMAKLTNWYDGNMIGAIQTIK